MEDLIQVDGRYYVSATSSRVDDRTRVLKHGDSFAVFDRYGDIQIVAGTQGLFHAGTRHLSRFELLLEDTRPILLNSTVKNDNTLLTVDLTNPDLRRGKSDYLLQDNIHFLRAKTLCQGILYEHLRIQNYSGRPANLLLAYEFAADFVDLFEVRGVRRERRGEFLPAEVGQHGLLLGYQGLDGITRHTIIEFSPVPAMLTSADARFELSMEPHQEQELFITVRFDEKSHRVAPRYDAVVKDQAKRKKRARAHGCHIEASQRQFSDWISHSQSDLYMLVSEGDEGPYPFAGIPWFSTPFGRDGLITAFEYLWMWPELARGVLNFLAINQAGEENPEQEAEPGKILHEMRKGEMAALGEIPFGRYYGTVDATPLFVMLAGAYYDITADRAFVERIWPNIQAALSWIDDYGDTDNDGFIEYQQHNPRGLVHQGWKDSNDSVFHADGRAATGHIALCEVQGYVYAARRAAATLARVVGKQGLGNDLDARADELKTRFNEAFWCDDIGTFALALDGEKKPCKVRTSNAGQVLWTGIAWPEYAACVTNTLMSSDSFSGWGVRTVAEGENRYNPMSYHNGSVWPHDNALIALGLSHYGFREGPLRILNGLFDASLHMDLHRLPELFCGFLRRIDEGPTRYPSSCVPQAWASGAVFALLQACLGMTFSSTPPHIRFHNPRLPDYLNHLKIHKLRVGGGSVDLLLQRHRDDVGVTVLDKEGEVQIAVFV